MNVSTHETTKICRSPSSAVIRFSGLNCNKRRNKSKASSDAFEIRFSRDFFGLEEFSDQYEHRFFFVLDQFFTLIRRVLIHWGHTEMKYWQYPIDSVLECAGEYVPAG